jgi:hypothetical protein
MIVPFAAGGGFDVEGRILAQRMSESLDQPVIVENIGGAAGTIGSSRVAKAAPDGYVFLLGSVGTHAYNANLYRQAVLQPRHGFRTGRADFRTADGVGVLRGHRHSQVCPVPIRSEQFEAKLGASAVCRIRPALAAPFFVIAMVLACVAICLAALAATIEGDNAKSGAGWPGTLRI